MTKLQSIRGARSLLCRSLSGAGGTSGNATLPASISNVSHLAGRHVEDGLWVRVSSAIPRDALWSFRRSFSDRADCCNPVGMSETEYNRIADECIDALSEKIEEFLEDAGVEPYDVESSMGVLTVKLGEKGTFVINKQTPNRQIWFSSPVSGPFRYDPVGDKWLYGRDSHSLHDKLQEEISELIGKKLEF
jgi:frataxin